MHLAEVHINFNHVGWLGNFSRQTEERKETASLRGRYEFTVSCFLFGNVAQGTCSAAGAVGAVVLDVPSLSSPAAARKGSPAAFSWNHGSIRQIMTQWSGVLVPLFVSFFFFSFDLYQLTSQNPTLFLAMTTSHHEYKEVLWKQNGSGKTGTEH